MVKNLISIDQLSEQDINEIHNRAATYFDENAKGVLLDTPTSQALSGQLLVNFFFENSTRTRMSFEIAAKRLGARVVNMDVSLSSLKKGESIIDTAKTINAMRPNFIAVRHNASGVLDILKPHLDAALINAGDGTNEHPSQALLDSFTIKRHKKDLKGLKVAICGDVLHSRVARSNIKLLKKFGCEVRVVTAPTLMVKGYVQWLKDKWDIEVFTSLEAGIQDVDVVMMLRIQQERMLGCYIPSLAEYFKLFGLTHEKLKYAKDDVLVLHPGPINRGVEISSELADDTNYSLVLEQVEAGVAVRQSILSFLS